MQDAELAKEHLINMASFRQDNPFNVVHETYDAERYDRKPRRKPTAQQ